MKVEKTCEFCGAKWMEKPSHAARRKYCSGRCFGLARRKPLVKKLCAICGDEFSPSHERKKVTICSKDKCKGELRHQIAKRIGSNPYKHVDEAKRLAGLRTKEHRESKRLLMLGKDKTGPLCARNSPSHIRAAEFFVRDPRGRVHHVVNISRFVRLNPHLFEEEDVQQAAWAEGKKFLACRATGGLHSISKGHRMSWHGWTLVSDREGRERFDLIGRNPVVGLATPGGSGQDVNGLEPPAAMMQTTSASALAERPGETGGPPPSARPRATVQSAEASPTRQ